jgi:hypothetical protein
MGLFWDLYQQSQIEKHREHTVSIDARVERLEREVDRMAVLLREVIRRLEQNVGKDLDADGNVG